MSATRRILIIEDDAALRATMAEQILSSGEFSTDEAESAADAEAKLSATDARYDAILLDIGLPDSDGRDFCTKLRRNGRQMPVIMVTGADAEGDVVRGLDAGANDYLAKPFRLPELQRGLARQMAARVGIRRRRADIGPGGPGPDAGHAEQAPIGERIIAQPETDAQGDGEHHQQVKNKSHGAGGSQC